MTARIKQAFNDLTAMQRSVLSALLALIGYGGWAWMVNAMHGVAAAAKAACVQGGYSFALTFIMTLLIESIYYFLVAVFGVNRKSVVITVVVTCAVIFSTSWWVNYLADTPEIFKTVILGYIIGTIYTVTYVLGLAQGRPQQPA